MLRALSIALLASLPCCHAPKESSQSDLHPQRDQVRFFERPLAVAVARKSAVRMPALVFIESDPWLDVVGSDSPSFALYEDGTVIERKGSGFLSTRLTRESRDKLLQSVSAEALRPFYGAFAATTTTDQTTEELLIYHGAKPVFISVYGSLKVPEVRSKIPRQVVAAIDRIKAFNPPAEHPWLPDNIEVMVSPYGYAPDAFTEWPRDLPDLHDPDTISRGDSFSIFVPASKLDEVRATLARRKEKGAILINGKKWAASIRFPFPQEQLWLAPNNEVRSSTQ